MTCVICNKIIQTEIDSSANNFYKTNEFTLKSLFQFFNIPFINIGNEKFNFAGPNFEFCSDCTNFVERLRELNENLEEIKMEIILTKNCIRSKIQKIQTLPVYNCENEEEMKLLKAWKHSDRNVEIIRDLIVGPRIYLKRISPAVINESSKPFPSSSNKDFVEHFEDDFVNDCSVSDPEIQGDSLTEIPAILTVDKKPQKRKYRQRWKRKTDAIFYKSTSPIISADTREKVLEEFFAKGMTAAPAFEDKSLKSENDEANEDVESDLTEKNRFPKRSSRGKISYEVKKESKEAEETAVKPEPDDNNSDQSSSYSLSSSSEEDYDDASDEDFILPDDAMETLVEDKRADARIKGTLRYFGRQREGIVPNKVSNTIRNYRKGVMEGKDQYRYGENLRFTGNSVVGFKCSQCTSGHVFKNKPHLYTHLTRVHLQTPCQYDCPTCGKILNSKVSYNYHMETHKEGTSVICETCGKSFSGKRQLRAHCYREHTEELQKDVICEYCGKSYKQKYYSHHVRYVHFKVHNKFRYFCEVCGKGFVFKETLTTHLSVHSTDRPVICDTCGQAFKTKRGLKKHNRLMHSEKRAIINHNPDLKCKICGMQAVKRNHLNRHLKLIHNIDVKQLAAEKKSKEHAESILKRVHSQELKYSCTLCVAAFVNRAGLRAHLVRHSTDRPFSCDKCGQQFKRKPGLTEHMRRHMESSAKSDNPDLQCKYCGVQYTVLIALSRHLKRVHNIEGKTLAGKKKAKAGVTETMTSGPDLVTTTNVLSLPGPSSNAIGGSLSTVGTTEPIGTDFTNELLESSAATADGPDGFPNFWSAVLPTNEWQPVE